MIVDLCDSDDELEVEVVDASDDGEEVDCRRKPQNPGTTTQSAPPSGATPAAMDVTTPTHAPKESCAAAAPASPTAPPPPPEEVPGWIRRSSRPSVPVLKAAPKQPVPPDPAPSKPSPEKPGHAQTPKSAGRGAASSTALVAADAPPPDIETNPECAAVWRFARKLLRERNEQPVTEVPGYPEWTMRFKLRPASVNNSGSKVGDICIYHPSFKKIKRAAGTSGDNVIRSLGTLHVALLNVYEARQQGVPVFEPPALGELVLCEVEDSFTPADEPEWRRADVRRVLADGSFLVCVHRPDGTPDDDFFEWYERRDEGIEWRRIEGAPKMEVAGEAGGAAKPCKRAKGHTKGKKRKEPDASPEPDAGPGPSERLAADQCQRNPLCVRGRKHPGHCKLRTGDEEAANEPPAKEAQADPYDLVPAPPAASACAVGGDEGAPKMDVAGEAGGAAKPCKLAKGHTKGKKRKEPDASPEADACTGSARAEPSPLPPSGTLSRDSPPTAHADASGGASGGAGVSSALVPFALAPSVAPSMEGVSELLVRYRLEAYIGRFEELGYDDLEFLLHMSDEMVDDLVEQVGFKSGHAHKFIHLSRNKPPGA